MKKALVLALMLVLAVSAGVFAQQRGELEVLVKVLPYAEIKAPELVNFKVEGDGSRDSKSLTVTIASNSPIKVTVQSQGFDGKLLNEMITYKLGLGNWGQEFRPGETWSVPYTLNGQENFEVEFQVDYAPGDQWHSIKADTYKDVIKWTVEAL
jgi:hypothetical protein